MLTNTHASARGTVVFGADDMDALLYAKCYSNVTFEKDGTGTLTINNTSGEMPGGTYGVGHKTLGSHFAGTGSLVV